VIERHKGAIPRATSSRWTEGTCRSITRISPFAGRVTEAALRRKAKLGAERVELWPAVTRMTCSDVMRVRRGDSKVSGRRLAGAHGGCMLSRKRTCPTRILDSLAPDHVARSRARKRAVPRVTLLAARYLGHRSRQDVPPGVDEGATGRDALHRGGTRCTKARSSSRGPIGDHSSFGGLVTDRRSRARTRELASAT
jgi:hypothetical protein